MGMKRRVIELSEEEILEAFPIKGEPLGWYFRCVETSNGVWLVEGTVRYGRRVSRQGVNEDALLQECEQDAVKIIEQLRQ